MAKSPIDVLSYWQKVTVAKSHSDVLFKWLKILVLNGPSDEKSLVAKSLCGEKSWW